MIYRTNRLINILFGVSMIEMNEYMKLSFEDRQSHLDLDIPCSENGGNGSTEYKGLLAYFLGTKIPARGQGYSAHLCHACGNGKCSNVKHLYWGTPKENYDDAVRHGVTKSIYEKTLAKYGEAGVKEIAARAGAQSGITQRMRSEVKWEEYRPLFEKIDMNKRGWSGRLAKQLGISHTHVKRIAKRLNLL